MAGPRNADRQRSSHTVLASQHLHQSVRARSFTWLPSKRFPPSFHSSPSTS